ncbi:hypothetical protein [Mesorhizobium sp. M1143]|uniref:hypothetical protein n=1 Tax=Mesorhizobium sp. M1143 TaxID=2957061 RepID=UPI003339AB6F
MAIGTAAPQQRSTTSMPGFSPVVASAIFAAVALVMLLFPGLCKNTNLGFGRNGNVAKGDPICVKLIAREEANDGQPHYRLITTGGRRGSQHSRSKVGMSCSSLA